MAIRFRAGDEADEATRVFLDIPPDTRCFFCGNRLTAIAVWWGGADQSELWLHPDCVIELTIRLYRDVWEIKQGTKLPR